MSGFDAAWLSLREPADAQARSRELATALADWLAPRARARAARIVDLGCGSGANRRFLAPLLHGRQHWSCVDDDASLLELATHGPTAELALEALQLDLATNLPAALTMRPDVITAAALLDLTSASWLQRLVAAADEVRAAMLFALSYDGRVSFVPAHDDDALVQRLFDAHQRRDKGFGPALGPCAAAGLLEALPAERFAVHMRASDWTLSASTAQETALLAPLVQGIASAACEQQPENTRTVDAWLAARLAHLQAGLLRVCIGHQDVLALPR